MSQLPLAITSGDCAGIGPEITAQAIAAFPDETFALYTHKPLFERACHQAKVTIPENIIWCDLPLNTTLDAIHPGKNQAATGDLAYRAVCQAGQAVLAGHARGLVTAPFSKAALHLAGHTDVPGHTELLARLCGREEATMAFFAPHLIISLVTIHCALSAVPALITPARLLRVLRDTAEATQRLLKRRPKIGVLALNPHAGECGAFGNEEAAVIIPALHQAQTWADFEGPLVPDTALITAPHKPRYDAFVAMYHDQGLIPFKHVAFDCGVNVTLGLPIIRTSPDHGTAFDLAWQGKASPKSMVQAIHYARQLTP
ncbi:MAG: 4-hydroxythreonine-4-phosphate dehydrogenase PdxA [Kiritimatiellae bacterium]|nr:4-hydroxythreonine-4-phosphate dehydrogenase PdxA [Kiritimatiellia bacterium]